MIKIFHFSVLFNNNQSFKNSLSFSYFNFHVKIGTNVAKINEQNKSDCDKKDGKKSKGKIIPIKIDFEKSGLGKNNIPAARPIIIEM